MTRTTAIVTPLLLFTLAGCGVSSHTETNSLGVVKPDESDEVVAFEDCPDGVQATITDHLDGGTITEIERTTDHGEVLFEVDVRTDDGVVEFDVAEDGTFRGYENDGDDDDDGDGDDDEGGDDDDGDGDDEHEEEIGLDQVPRKVLHAAQGAVDGVLDFHKAFIEHEGDVVVYELQASAGDVAYEIEVTAGGEVLEVETGWD